MKFSNDTRLPIDSFEESIPIIHGKNYYIDEQGYVSTYNKAPVNVVDTNGDTVKVQSIKPVTEFISIVNNRVAYHTSIGIVVTSLVADKQKYIGGFQGIAGFTETETSYTYMNASSTLKSTITLTGRLNANKQLELKLINFDSWFIPLGEFRCFINDTLYTISYNTVLPNSFGETFDVTLLGWTTVSLSDNTNYIRDIFISGNTLYLSTRLKLIGSTPYDWSSVDTSIQTVIWSEDSRLTGGYFVGSPTSTNFFVVNYNTSSIYWINGTDFSVLQEYTHNVPILGTGSIDKFSIAIVDKEALSILSAYVSLNTWLMKTKIYFKFNQLSAYEEIVTNYLLEDVYYDTSISSLTVHSKQRQDMMFYILNNQVLSGCHTDTDIISGDFHTYIIENNNLYAYTKVEDSGEYEQIDEQAGIISFDSCIYIGSDLEPDIGGSTMRDTEIIFEGKISIVDGDTVSIESSTDVPVDQSNLPVRTEQQNPDNWWYLYTKTLKYPVSYTDWLKVTLMPTTKIFNIKLAQDQTQTQKKKGGK